MKAIEAEKNWVSKKMLRAIFLVWLACTLIGIFCYKIFILAILCSILSSLSLILFLFMFYAHHKLSPKGGNFQSKVSALVTDKIETNASGRLLDIGCGSGILSVELAIKCPLLKINGIDYWGSMWGYAKEKCEKLAKDNNVSDQICFERASASSLPFEDESFDIVISNMVFHEVADVKDKKEVIKEALRVLKKGGLFVFQDLLLNKKLYGNREYLVQYVKDLNIESVSLTKTAEQLTIPRLLNCPMFFSDTALLSGKK
ncbi:class I SAM-dependent methyltransferase [Massilibacteroides sp.]|uniref:class I SAM-dependent methyltransferase n=1 Tax=Massilibacteroides sp. TaxID=2034766 RepID=UPI002608C09A|nr:class I SAM-dependent methyltransferase [Massilibacteroides sp.]MDD4514178.1 class I SAM-dependent methyltransferase [Massilibacteroides sp.]